ncbi:MAG TPA: kelch repeat-containing protein [Terriglobia bacterium]|nr:kelch repeat-containing protein [Terriglobia bacterium]
MKQAGFLPKLLVALLFAAATAGGQTWSQLGPVARYGHTAVFDPMTQKMIVFGGLGSNGPFNDVWASNAYTSNSHNLKWTQVIGSSRQNAGADLQLQRTEGENSNGEAPPRAYTAAVFWSAKTQIILWGGLINHAGKDWYDGHEFNLPLMGLKWTHDGPRSRQAHSAVYDPDTNAMIIFGGIHSAAFGPINDAFVTPVSAPNENWQGQIGLQNAPPPVYGHVAGYNPSTRVMVVATGATGIGTLGPCLNGVWQLANANLVGTPSWSQPLVTGTAPSARAFSAAIYDSVSDTLTIFGGTDCNGNYLQDVWTLSNATGKSPSWSQRTVVGTPPSVRESATAVYDSASNTLILFGGDQGGNNFLGDVWTLSNANGRGSGSSTWTLLNPTGGPPAARSGHWAVYNPATGIMYIGSGNAYSGMLSDTWQLTNATGLSGTPVWSQLATTGNLRNTQATAVLAGSSIITFGGQVPIKDYFSATYDIAGVLVVP